ncbi:MAG: NUDIX hydrolase [Candidatus Neomarinimicrobiota bacterium]
MSRLKEIQISSVNIYTGNLLDVWVDRVKLPDNSFSSREYIKHPGAVVIVPALPDGKIGLIRQYRYPMGREFIELPAGKVDPGEKPIDTAARELEEEIGYQAGKLRLLTEISPCIGYSNERMWLFLAQDLTASAKNMDQDEFIEFMPTPLEAAEEMVWQGKISDVKTIIGILWTGRILGTKRKEKKSVG